MEPPTDNLGVVGKTRRLISYLFHQDSWDNQVERYDYLCQQMRDLTDVDGEFIIPDGRYDPRAYSTLDQAEQALDTFEEWIGVFERYNNICEQVQDLTGQEVTFLREYHPGSYETRPEAEQALDEFEEWIGVFKRYNSICEQVQDLSGQEATFVEEYHPGSYETRPEAEQALDEFEVWIEQYKRYNAVLSRAEAIAESNDFDFERDGIPSHLDKADDATELQAIVNELDDQLDLVESYSNEYTKTEKVAEETGHSEHFDLIITSPGLFITNLAESKVQSELDHLPEWRRIYEEYWKLWGQLETGKTPIGLNLTDIDGVGTKTAKRLERIGIKTPRDVSSAEINDLTQAEKIGPARAGKIKSDASRSIYGIELTDLPSVGSETASNLKKAGFGTIARLLEMEKEELQKVPRIADRRATALLSTVDVTVGNGTSEAHTEYLSRKYTLTDESLSEATSQLEELREWVDTYRSYFRYRHRAYQLAGSSNELSSGTQPLPFDAIQYKPSQNESLDEVKLSLRCFEEHLCVIENYNDLTSKVETLQSGERQQLGTSICEVMTDGVRALDTQRQTQDQIERLNVVHNCLSAATKLIVCIVNYQSYPFNKIGTHYDQILRRILDGDTVEWNNSDEHLQIIDQATTILEFLVDTDEEHPAVKPGVWSEAILTAIEENAPGHLEPVVSQIERIRDTEWTIEHLRTLDWRELESVVGSLYRSQGYKVDVTGGTADMGVDVWANKNGQRLAIQVKHYKEGTVGREPLQKITSTIAKGDANKAVVVTTGSFTNTAEQYRQDFGGRLELINRNSLLRRLSSSKVPPPSSTD
jgi:tetratricopeptide (TPR) repeat protein